MIRDYLEAIAWEPPMKIVRRCRDTSLGVMCSALLALASCCEFAIAAPDTASTTNTQDEQNCSALTGFNLQDVAGGPAIIMSAQLVDVPASGLERFSQSGYAGPVARRPSPIRRDNPETELSHAPGYQARARNSFRKTVAVFAGSMINPISAARSWPPSWTKAAGARRLHSTGS